MGVSLRDGDEAQSSVQAKGLFVGLKASDEERQVHCLGLEMLQHSGADPPAPKGGEEVELRHVEEIRSPLQL